MILPADGFDESPFSGLPKFGLGQLVKHRRYSYRGVVVAIDKKCLAPETWYQGNQTKPKRDQPWYHVLVNQSVAVTYAAQENLMVDALASEIQHPLIAQFFDDFEKGRYLRNDTPWPGWDH